MKKETNTKEEMEPVVKTYIPPTVDDVFAHSRRWSGAGGIHPYKNKLNGAFGATRAELRRKEEAINRLKKAKRALEKLQNSKK